MEVKDMEFTSGNAISNVNFSFFSAKCVREASVKQVHPPVQRAARIPDPPHRAGRGAACGPLTCAAAADHALHNFRPAWAAAARWPLRRRAWPRRPRRPL